MRYLHIPFFVDNYNNVNIFFTIEKKNRNYISKYTKIWFPMIIVLNINLMNVNFPE